jgi:hypothetical protein
VAVSGAGSGRDAARRMSLWVDSKTTSRQCHKAVAADLVAAEASA